MRRHLLLVEPDFGAAVVLCATGTAVLFVAGARFRDFLVVCAVGLLAVAALALASPYRVLRITAFLNPWEDPFKTGFQLTQSLIAIGRGEWFGVGLGSSIQKLYYLPEAHTDFVFAVFSEEFGLLGVTLVVAAFLALVLRSLRLSRIAADAGMPLHACIAAGFGVWIGLQAFLNIGVNMGLLPTKGLTLPLLSYGRSSMLVTLPGRMLLRVHHEVVASGKSAIPSEGVRQSRTVMISRRTGRLFPALAIAGQLRASDIVWLGTERGIEARLVPAAGYPVDGSKWRFARQGFTRWLAAPVPLARGDAGAARAREAQARRRARLRRLCLGSGRHCSLALGGAARDPCAERRRRTHEPLARVRRLAHRGRIPRQLSGVAQGALRRQPGASRDRGASAAAAALRIPERPERLFVFGGSQGATALNLLVPAAVALLPEGRRPWVLHQTGTKDRDATEAAYRAAGIQAEVRPFIDDMAAAYANADLVISRAGASTVAELAAAGLGSILVPFPAAVDDHQTKNAEWLGRVSAAQVVSETGLTAPELANRIATLFGSSRSRLLAMAEAARARRDRRGAPCRRPLPPGRGGAHGRPHAPRQPHSPDRHRRRRHGRYRRGAREPRLCGQGSDLRANAVTARLAKMGVRIFIGHEAGQVAGASVVVVSSAVQPANRSCSRPCSRASPWCDAPRCSASSCDSARASRSRALTARRRPRASWPRSSQKAASTRPS